MLHSQKDIEKCVISAADGEIGQVKDIYFDDRAWAIRYLIVDTGSWLSERKVLISPISLKRLDWAANKLHVAITQDQVKHSPIIDTDKPVSRQHEEQQLGYYGYPNYWGGIGLWGNGMLPMGLYPGSAELPGGNEAQQQSNEQSAMADKVSHQDDDPHLRSCSAVIGYHIHAIDGEVGHVDGFLIDDESWAIRYLVIKGVHWPDRTVTVDLNREAVKAAPDYDALIERNR
jgi:sporulation protein YlmC with PRC-barrel domain